MEENDEYVCFECIGDKYLKEEVQSTGKRSTCTYCKEEKEAVTIESLANRIHEVFEEQFYQTSDQPQGHEYTLMKEFGHEWERQGEPVDVIIQEIADIDKNIANDIREFLSDRHGCIPSDYIGEEEPYDGDAHYLEQPANKLDYQHSWEFFRRQLAERRRFINSNIEQILLDIFDDLHSLRAYDQTPIIRSITPENPDRFIFRARIAERREDVYQIQEKLIEQLGAPPHEHARSGRMNAEGISVFYGAEDIDTCVAEVRPFIGSYVVTGKFEFIKESHLLDFDALKKAYPDKSHFDPDYSRQKGKIHFLEELVNELTKPITPNEEAIEYLPTQFIAEFLAERITPRLDGIIFPSVQAGNGKRNIVLFNHASKTDPCQEELPSPPENIDDSIFSTIPSLQGEHFDRRDITLRLDLNSIKIFLIEGVAYNKEENHVSWQSDLETSDELHRN